MGHNRTVIDEELLKEQFLESLRITPSVAAACHKVGIKTPIVYGWKRADRDFWNKVLETLEIVREDISDMAEEYLVQEIAKGNVGAIKFWLKHNRDPYVQPRKTKTAELLPQPILINFDPAFGNKE